MMNKMTGDEDLARAAATARQLVRCGRRAALATLDGETGVPYASLVAMASDADGAPLLLLSGLARHTRNLLESGRVSLLVDQGGTGDPLASPRVTLWGDIARTDAPLARQRYLSRQPAAAGYAGFADFAIYRLEPEGAHLVAGFGQIHTLPRDMVMTRTDDAADLLAAETGATEHMNADHRDALSLYAEELLGAAPGGDWRSAGLDPAGCELISGEGVLYLPFPERVAGPGELRRMLVRLAEEARGVSAGRTPASAAQSTE
jgi:putative heme iron utilization protein